MKQKKEERGRLQYNSIHQLLDDGIEKKACEGSLLRRLFQLAENVLLHWMQPLHMLRVRSRGVLVRRLLRAVSCVRREDERRHGGSRELPGVPSEQNEVLLLGDTRVQVL